MAYSLLLFFSRTRYTFPTSPFPMSLILSKLDGPTSTVRTLMLLLLYVRRNATFSRILPGLGIPSMPEIGSKSPGMVSTIESALLLPCMPMPFIFDFSKSAVGGRLSSLPSLFFLFLLEKRPCAFGALATLLSFLANSSFPVTAAAWFPKFGPPVFCWLLGVSGGEGGTLLSLWCRNAGSPWCWK